ncbi:hypothetical protein GCM10009795_047830 [Nocardioides hankookensis]|uniref:Uncharacterized protein n=1 Tax=Nocardioides hankookensis TaxID=443157 RepID=A0ABW1LFR1_9ACTN
MSFEGYPSRHFSIANERHGEHENDLPHLLRRVATRIEELDLRPMDILDVTIHQDITENGPWWAATVYWSPDVD